MALLADDVEICSIIVFTLISTIHVYDEFYFNEKQNESCILRKNLLMPDSSTCPQCKSIYAYPTGTSMMCPECGHEWNPDELVKTEETSEQQNSSVIKDSNGTVLQDGDTVVIIKDLPVKGSSKPIKAGTKVKNIKLTSGDHNIDCKVEGFGAMALKSIYVRKG